MRNTWIRRISAIRKDGVESAINLTCGLNCIIGASNTGKTRIAKTVEFACGGKELPFTDKTAYEIAQVTFVTNGGEVSLSRSIHVQNTIHVKSSNPMIVPGSYSVSSRAGKSINTVLLALLGVESTRRIATNDLPYSCFHMECHQTSHDCPRGPNRTCTPLHSFPQKYLSSNSHTKSVLVARASSR